ncbi:uncharacterized protein [Aegilops tauschii subsp. strangulata]|uniref:uncharacterized protein n=1 Tax=Aegilops tauschii subsp. strangulata TaxID=200361 RepID=UPI00098B46F2
MARFIIQEQVGEVTLGAVDVECIFNLENQGLSTSDILTEEGEDIKERVPPQFLSKTSENIVIDNLIDDIIKSKATNDDFLRKVVLVLLGTIIAPMSSKIVPKQYYALVDDVKRISKINWNAFTLRVLLDCLRIVKKGKHLRQWLKGNLALLQYLYWEKVQPVEGECAYNPNLSIQPLMRNWTEGAATRRGRFDYDNGRGRGNVRIENNITQEYRAQEPNIPNNAPTMKPKTKPANGNAKKSMTTPMSEDLMELLMKRCMDFIHTQMRQIPDQVAERLLEKLNKSGVMYKPAAAVPSADNDVDEELDSFENGPYEKKEFVYKDDIDSRGEPVIDMTQPDEVVPNHKTVPEKTPPKMNGHKEASPIKRNDECGATPENTWVVAMFSENHEPEVVADELTPEIIDAAVSFVELAASTEKNRGKKVYYSEGRGISLTSERIRPVLTHRWLSDDVIDAYMGHLELRVGHDRYLCPAWRSKFLVDRAIARDDPLPSSCNMDSALSKAGAFNRVTKEYTVRDKTYIALNIDNAHWMTVVMHLIKQEFQVLDSLYPLDLTEKTVKALRMAIAHDMHLANLITPGKYPDVSKWPIKEYDMPPQEDGNSCGLFVTECLEHWDGDRMTRDFSQATIDARRRRFVAELIMSPSNKMECVKNKIHEIARKRRA